MDPRQISARAKIVSDEISNPEKVLGYLENKELTTVDRTLISTSRALLAASKNAVDQMNKGQTMAYGLMANIWTYNRQLFKQLGEVSCFKFFFTSYYMTSGTYIYILLSSSCTYVQSKITIYYSTYTYILCGN